MSTGTQPQEGTVLPSSTDLGACGDRVRAASGQSKPTPSPREPRHPHAGQHRPLTSGQSSLCEGVPGRHGVSWREPAGAVASGDSGQWASAEANAQKSALGHCGARDTKQPSCLWFPACLNRFPGHPQLRGRTPGKGRGTTGWIPSWWETDRDSGACHCPATDVTRMCSSGPRDLWE